MMALNYLGLAVGLSIASCMLCFAWHLHKDERTP